MPVLNLGSDVSLRLSFIFADAGLWPQEESQAFSPRVSLRGGEGWVKPHQRLGECERVMGCAYQGNCLTGIDMNKT